MKKIITAIGNYSLNKKLRKYEECEVLLEDIEIDNRLIEYLEIGEDVDILFLSTNIIRNYDVEDFIEIIRRYNENVLIIFFTNEKIEIDEDDKLKIFDVLDFDSKKLDEVLEIKNDDDLKKVTSKVIAISGTKGVGKSIFSTLLAKVIENKKTLLIDFDLEENQIRNILKIKNKNYNPTEIRDCIINKNKNLDILCYLDLIIPQEKDVDFFKIQDMMKELKEQYELIIIDTSSNMDKEYTKRIFYQSDEIIFLLEPNFIGIKKSKYILEVFFQDWKISKNKIKLLLNKTNAYQIEDCVLKEIFSDIKLIGKIKYSDKYNLIINKDIHKREIEKEYKKILKKII